MIAVLLAFIKRILNLVGVSTDAAGTATVFARLKQIFDNMLLKSTWTDAKASYLDDKISSRAPASTALSAAQWTNARAEAIDTINANVKTVNTNASAVNTKIGTNTDAMGSTTIFARLAQLYGIINGILTTGGVPGTVKSIQRGWVYTTGNTSSYGTYYPIAISSVTTHKTHAIVQGFIYKGSQMSGWTGMPQHIPLRSNLISSTELDILLELPGANYDSFFLALDWTVIEYY